MIRKTEWEVRVGIQSVARPLLAQWHYARTAGSTHSYIHILYRVGDPAPMGVVWWQAPGSPNVARWAARQFQGDVKPGQVLALSRMAVSPSAPKGACSYLLGQSIRLIRAARKFRVAVTYADHRQGHTGGVYRASGWTCAGTSSPHAKWTDARGCQVSTKATSNRTHAEMRAAGYSYHRPMAKTRYIRAITRVKMA